MDRYASIGTGWPMTVDEKDIMSNLPSSEEAYEMSRPEQTPTLAEAMTPAGAGKLTSFGAIVLMACLFGRNLNHLHRPDVDGDDDSMNGEFWRRHRTLDNVILNTSLCLPSKLKLPEGLTNPNTIFANMCIHTSTICLHQAAIFKADKARLPGSVSTESKIRCINGANEIASIMRMISHLDLASMNPFISFCLYVAGRVFIQYLKSSPDNSAVIDSLRFLLSAMNALKKRNPLTESFLVQLDVDLEVLGSRVPKLKNTFPCSTDKPIPPNIAGDLRPANSEGTPSSGRRNGSAGHLAGKNECHFLKRVDDDGCAVNAPDLGDSNPSPGTMSQTSSSAGAASRPWESGQQPVKSSTTSLPTRHSNNCGARSYSTSMESLPVRQGYLIGAHSPNAMSGTSGEQGRTPGSSSASDVRQNINAQDQASGQTSAFGRSPQLQTTNDVEAAAAASAFFDMQTPQFGMGPDMGTGLTPRFNIEDPSSGNEFAVPVSWGDLGAGTGMTPVANETLRNLMSMGSMDGIDMGAWETNTSMP